MFGFIRKIFLGLLDSLVNASTHTKCELLSNQKFTTQRTIINLHPNEYMQRLHYHQFVSEVVTLLISDLSNKVCALNETED